MVIFVAHLTLVFFSRALESMHMYRVTTFVASVSSSMWLLVVLGFLDMIGCCVFGSLVLFWPTEWSSLLADLSDLQVTGYLFDVACSCL